MHNEKDETFGTNGMDDKRLERFLEKNLKEEETEVGNIDICYARIK